MHIQVCVYNFFFPKKMVLDLKVCSFFDLFSIKYVNMKKVLPDRKFFDIFGYCFYNQKQFFNTVLTLNAIFLYY